MSAQKPEENADLTARLRSPQTVRAAFDEAMRLYAEPLYWQIRRLVQSHDDADDILQNTFMKAWMSIENFRGEAKLSTWLYKIAINESISFLEKERKRRHLSLDDQEAEMVSQIARRPSVRRRRARTKTPGSCGRAARKATYSV